MVYSYFQWWSDQRAVWAIVNFSACTFFDALYYWFFKMYLALASIEEYLLLEISGIHLNPNLIRPVKFSLYHWLQHNSKAWLLSFLIHKICLTCFKESIWTFHCLTFRDYFIFILHSNFDPRVHLSMPLHTPTLPSLAGRWS